MRHESQEHEVLVLFNDRKRKCNEKEGARTVKELDRGKAELAQKGVRPRA